MNSIASPEFDSGLEEARNKAKPCDSNNNAGLQNKLDDNEDWHILDADESEQSQRRNSMASNHSLGPKSSGPNKYIELDPLGPHQNRSPALIHLCTAIYSLLPLASILSTFSLVALLFTRFYFVTLAYLLYLILDRDTCNKGGSRIDCVYRSSFWSYLAAYFPIKLRYTAQFKLNPDRNYILNYHPHGISAFGSVCAFATNGLRLCELFPGIRSRFMVHETSFKMPVMKEVFGSRGDCSVNSKSIDYMLSRSGTGNLLTIVVGGLAEADLSDAETLKIVISKRKGFIKKALVHGADIIPCIAFGENSVFTKVNLDPSTPMHKLESKFYQLFKFKHPIYYGRSVFSDNLRGVMPFKRPITVVLGEPIRVDRLEEPSQESIDGLHDRYLESLRSMYADNGDLCSVYDRVLELV